MLDLRFFSIASLEVDFIQDFDARRLYVYPQAHVIQLLMHKFTPTVPQQGPLQVKPLLLLCSSDSSPNLIA